MAALADREIIPIKKGTAAVKNQLKEELLNQLPGWEVIDREGVPRLERTYEFSNFKDALAFTNQVGEIAEEVNHHPAILFTWGWSRVSWWTHDIGGLHQNDFIMAARTDQLYNK